MNVLIKVFYISIVGMLTLGLSGCGCLFPYTPNTVQNLYIELYSEAESLRHRNQYSAAVKKYEQAFRIRPRSAKIIDARFPALLKYRIAFCYAKLAEAEGDISIYMKAEAAVRESYQTAILPGHEARILYLWGYILFKQARYEEARTQFEALTGREIGGRLIWDGLYALGKASMALGNKTDAQRAFNRLETNIGIFLQNYGWFPVVGDGRLYALGKAYLELGDETAARRTFAIIEKNFKSDEAEGLTHAGDEVLYRLGKAYLELGNETAARRTFAQFEKLTKTYLHRGYPYVRIEILYVLGKAYLELGDEAAARRIFAMLEEIIKTYLQKGWPYVGTEILYGLGKARLELGDEAAAQRAFTQLLKHYPNTSYKTEVKRLLENRR